MAVPTLNLSNEAKIPTIGLGTFMGKDLYTVTKISIRFGYRLIDTAFYYRNQRAIGEAIKEKIEDGTVKREELFVVDKLWNTQHQPEKVLPALKQNLSDLQLDYVDAFLMHWPIAYRSEDEYADIGLEETISIEDTWRAMETCVRKGYAKSIGVSNFNKQQLERILKIATSCKPVINQIECHPYLIQKDLIDFCKKRKIVVMAYSPLYAPNRNPHISIFKDPVILELAEKYQKSCSQIVLRYLTQVGVVPIPKSEKPIRIKQNIDIFNFSLSITDIRILESLNKNRRCVAFPAYAGFSEYPF